MRSPEPAESLVRDTTENATVPNPGNDQGRTPSRDRPNVGVGPGSSPGSADPVAEPEGCTHDPAQFVTADEGTGYCPACEAEETPRPKGDDDWCGE